MLGEEQVSRRNRQGGIQVLDITGDERDRILTLDEDHFCDLKGIDIQPVRLTRTLSAFANAAGGELFVGIGEREFLGTKDRYWNGFKGYAKHDQRYTDPCAGVNPHNEYVLDYRPVSSRHV